VPKQESKNLPKPAHIATIIELMSRGAKDSPVPLTTIELAQKLGKSQQVVSKHLEELERDGMIERFRRGRKTYVKLSDQGAQKFSNLYSTLHKVFGMKGSSFEVEGVVFSGLGEAAYYVSQDGYNKQFVAKLGFEPFPGTLNLRLESTVDREIRRQLISGNGSIQIEGFKDGKRTFGGAQCFRAKIADKLPAAVILIERTIYDDSVLELIAPVNLRRVMKLKDGTRVRVRIFLNGDASKIC
jgi:riboflavin kinase, archaea type